ncbi:MAG: cupin-like domain-containing protein, partial [Myxococcales bacterium]|nr:cupin-like domain-containing protein [Myxococcales bacterium]
RRPRDRRVLALPWRRWLADNLARGADPAALAELLRGAGVPEREIARRTLEAGEAVALAQAARRRAERAEQVLRLHAALRGEAITIERRTTPDADEFFERYWATSTPVILSDLVPRWPAFGRWSPAHLRERYGEVEIEAELGRAGDVDPDINYLRHRQTLRLADYVDRVLAAGESDDLYLIARNHNLTRPGLRPLLDDLALPPGYFDEARIADGAALWFGPAGTLTRLHHDCSNILFCQVVGRKRLRLGAPDDLALLGATRGVYSRIDPEAAAGSGARFVDLTLAPGEALFLPVGWWHHVRALDLSISVALNAFARPNTFDWYKPGTA